jgi:hypothetical protein
MEMRSDKKKVIRRYTEVLKVLARCMACIACNIDVDTLHGWEKGQHTKQHKVNFIFFLSCFVHCHWKEQDVGPWWLSATLIGLFGTVTLKKTAKKKKGGMSPDLHLHWRIGGSGFLFYVICQGLLCSCVCFAYSFANPGKQS